MANKTRIIKAKIQFDTLAAEKSAKALEKEIKKLTKNLEKAEAGTKEFTKAEQQLEKALNKVGRSTKNLTKDIKKETQAHQNSATAIQREIAEQKRLQSTLDVTSIEYKQAGLQISALNAKMNQSTGATGLASASAMEFGRVISDAPYGIRGVANNVSQLSAMLSQAAIGIDATTGKMIGFSGAIKQTISAMMGPLGILLAIQAVIAAVDYFYGSSKKAEEATDDLADAFSKLYGEITEAILKLEVYSEVYEKATAGSNKHTAALKELKDLGFDPATMAIGEFIKKQKELVVVEATLGEYGDTIEKLADARAMADDMIAESNENLAKERAALTEAEVYAAKVQAVSGKLEFVSQAKYNDALKETQRLTKLRGNIFLNEADAAEKYKKKLEELLDLTIVKPEKGGRSRARKDFEARQLDMWKEALSFSKKQLQLQDITDKEKLASTQKYEALALQVKKDAFIEAEAMRLRKFIKKNPAKEKQATANFNKAATVAEEQLQMALSALGVLHSEQRFGQQRDALVSFNETQLEERLSSAEAQSEALKDYDNQIVGYGSLAYLEENQREVWALKDAQFEEDQIKLGEKLYAEYGNWEQVSTILAENKNQYEIERMQEEIDLEQQKIDRKKEINAEYISWVAGLSGVLKGIAGENEALATAALVLEKGSAIADIIIKTQAANATVAATTAANASAVALVPGLPAVLAAQGKARILKNNIGAGISIAKIAATSLTSGGSPSSSGGGGDGGGGGTTFNPNFNVVGNSGQNQLAQSISGQVNSPTRAYVVYDDIDEASNLQNNAISSSGLG